MADEEVAHAERRLEVLQQVQHHRLDGDVERRGRLVEDDEVGFERDGAGDADARLLAAGELVREAVEQVERQADQARELLAARPHGLAPRDGLKRRIGSAMARAAVKRGLRLSVGSWKTIWMRGAHREAREAPRRDRADVLAVEDDAAGGRVEQAHHHHRGGGLAAAGFADEPDALAPPHREGDAVDRPERRLFGRRLVAAAEEARPCVLRRARRGYSLTRFVDGRAAARPTGDAGRAPAAGAPSGRRSRRPMPGRGVARISLRV